MTKIPLAIDRNYCSSWSIWHGVRELLQNAKDAEDFGGHKMEVTHFPRTGRLEITTRSVWVDPGELLILGKTSKGAGGQRGKFGEGFVLGVLALVRKGIEVRFRNDYLSWTVGFETPDPGHPFEGKELLTFRSREIKTKEHDFVVEVTGIPEDAWLLIRRKVLFLEEPKDGDVIRLPEGTLLLHPDKRGEVYVHGLFVRKFDDLSCGYDLKTVALDRDRQMIDEWDLHYRLGELWASALARHPELTAPRVYDMARSGAADARLVKHHADQRLLGEMRSRFREEHGEGAIPVTTNAEAGEAQRAGGRAAMVSGILKELLEQGGLSLEAARKQLEGTVDRRWAPADLMADADARAKMARLEEIIPSMAIVTFKGDNPGCRLIDEDKVVGVDRRLLAGPFKEVLAQAVTAEAARLSVTPLDVLIAHVAGEPAA